MSRKGHGHVIPNVDGSRARCGGPSMCPECARELAITRDKYPERVNKAAPPPASPEHRETAERIVKATVCGAEDFVYPDNGPLVDAIAAALSAATASRPTASDNMIFTVTGMNGDKWEVRACDSEDNCVVVHYRMKRRPVGPKTDEEREILDSLAAIVPPPTGEFIEYDENDLHIPLERLGDLIDALRQFDRRAGAPISVQHSPAPPTTLSDPFFSDPACGDRPERLAAPLTGIFEFGKWRLSEIDDLIRAPENNVDSQDDDE